MPDNREKIPVGCPVTVMHLVAADRDGNKQELYVVHATDGALVETFDPGHTGIAPLYLRWPWFWPGHRPFYEAHPFGGSLTSRSSLGTASVLPRVSVPPEEYDSWLDGELPDSTQVLRDMADAVQAHGWKTT